ncbi:L-threonylcarbamoyladenylate synthase [Nitrospira sp. M1]
MASIIDAILRIVLCQRPNLRRSIAKPNNFQPRLPNEPRTIQREHKEGYARLDDRQTIDGSITRGQSVFNGVTCRFGITGTAIGVATVLHIPQTLTSDILETASQCILHDGVLAVATESTYAFAAGAKHPRAIDRIVQMKGDRQTKPMLLLVSSKAQVLQVVSALSSTAEFLMDRFWPGPLTLILPAAPDLPGSLTAGSETIGVRQPSQPQLLQLLASTGPLTGTSANRSGLSPATTSEEIMREFAEEVDMILDSGPSPGGFPSTLLDVVDDIRVRRHGPITVERLDDALSHLGQRCQDHSSRS